MTLSDRNEERQGVIFYVFPHPSSVRGLGGRRRRCCVRCLLCQQCTAAASPALAAPWQRSLCYKEGAASTSVAGRQPRTLPADQHALAGLGLAALLLGRTLPPACQDSAAHECGCCVLWLPCRYERKLARSRQYFHCKNSSHTALSTQALSALRAAPAPLVQLSNALHHRRAAH